MKKIIVLVCIICVLLFTIVVPTFAYSQVVGGRDFYIVRPTVNSNLSVHTDDGVNRYNYNVPSVDLSFDTVGSFQETSINITNPSQYGDITTYNLSQKNINANDWYKNDNNDNIIAYELNRWMELTDIKKLQYRADKIDLAHYYGNGQVLDSLVIQANNISTYSYGNVSFTLTYCYDLDEIVGPINDRYNTVELNYVIDTSDVSIDGDYVIYNVGAIITNSIADYIDGYEYSYFDDELPVRIEDLTFEITSSIDSVLISSTYLSSSNPANNSSIVPLGYISDNGTHEIIYVDRPLNLDQVGTSLLGAVDGFLQFEVFPGVSLINILYVMVGCALLVIILKLYAGG